MKIGKILLGAGILAVCTAGVYVVTLWNSMSVDFDQFGEDEDD